MQRLRPRRVAQVGVREPEVAQRAGHLHVVRPVRRLLDRQGVLVQLLRPRHVAQLAVRGAEVAQRAGHFHVVRPDAVSMMIGKARRAQKWSYYSRLDTFFEWA